MTKSKEQTNPQITVSGVTFSAEQVKSAVVTIDGRDVFIGEKAADTPKIGFPTAQGTDIQKGK